MKKTTMLLLMLSVDNLCIVSYLRMIIRLFFSTLPFSRRPRATQGFVSLDNYAFSERFYRLASLLRSASPMS